MMKSLIPAALLALTALAAQAAQAEDGAQELVVQLNGPGLAESAGYRLALAHGYYAERGLQVTLHPAGDDIPLESLARGTADLAVEYLPVALVARENGLPAVNFAQPFARPALRLTCHAEAGVSSAADLRGRTLGSRFDGLEFALSAWLNRLGLRADDSLDGVAILKQWPDAAGMLHQRQVACIGSKIYVLPEIPDTVTLDPAVQGASVLEDGLYVLQDKLNDPQMRDRLTAFQEASMQGWHESARDPRAAAALILGPEADPGALERQTRAITGIAALLSPDGSLDEGDYNRSVDNLLTGGADAVLHRPPQGAFTPEISRALKLPATTATDTARNAPP